MEKQLTDALVGADVQFARDAFCLVIGMIAGSAISTWITLIHQRKQQGK